MNRKETRDEIVKDKSFAKFIKQGKIFINTETGKRFSIIGVNQRPINENLPWSVNIKTYVNGRTIETTLSIETLYEGLKDYKQFKPIN